MFTVYQMDSCKRADIYSSEELRDVAKQLPAFGAAVGPEAALRHKERGLGADAGIEDVFAQSRRIREA